MTDARGRAVSPDDDVAAPPDLERAGEVLVGALGVFVKALVAAVASRPSPPRTLPAILDSAIPDASPAARAFVGRAMASATARADAGERRVGAGHVAILRELAIRGPLSRSQIVLFAKLRPSSVSTYLPHLARAGFVVEGASSVTITHDGIARAGALPPKKRGKDLRDETLRTLPQGESAMLEALFLRYPHRLTRAELAAATGLAIDSVKTYAPRLAKRMVATETHAGLVAATDLFVD